MRFTNFCTNPRCALQNARKRKEKRQGKRTEKGKGSESLKKENVLALRIRRLCALNTSRDYIMCKTSKHPLYLCARFKQLLKRIEAIKNAKLCYNCLRSHRGNACKFFNCTICQKKIIIHSYTLIII